MTERPPREPLVRRGVTSARSAGKAVAEAARAGGRRLTPGSPSGVRPRRRPLALPPFRRLPMWRVRMIAVLGVLGPGLVSGFADNDAGGITTYSLAGAKFGYELLWVILASQIVLFFTQEVGARLGLATGKGLMGLIRERYGVRWGAFAVVLMLVANLGSTVAEFAGIGAALGLFGVPAQLSAALAAVIVVGFIAAGSFRRVQYIFVAVGIFVSAAYVISAIMAKPDWGEAPPPLAGPPAVIVAGLLAGRGGYRGHDHHALGPGLHPVLHRSTSACVRKTCRRAAWTSSRGPC